MESQRVLVDRAVAGDKEALSSLLAMYHDQLHARVASKIGSKYQSAFSPEDVLQVTYLEAFLRIGQFACNGDQAFLKWVDKIASNNIRDSIRELDRKKRPPRDRQVGVPYGDDSYVDLLSSLPGSQGSPCDHASLAEIKVLIEAALEQLPPDYAFVIRGFDLEGRSVAELADAADCSKGSIYMRRARAHDWMAEILGESTNFFGKTA